MERQGAVRMRFRRLKEACADGACRIRDNISPRKVVSGMSRAMKLLLFSLAIVTMVAAAVYIFVGLRDLAKEWALQEKEFERLLAHHQAEMESPYCQIWAGTASNETIIRYARNATNYDTTQCADARSFLLKNEARRIEIFWMVVEAYRPPSLILMAERATQLIGLQTIVGGFMRFGLGSGPLSWVFPTPLG